MIKIKIGSEEHNLEDVENSWITQQINRRRASGEIVCVQVRINDGKLNLILQTPTCPSRGGGGRPPTAQERDIFDLWDRLGLNDINFTGGNLIAFLNQLMQVA